MPGKNQLERFQSDVLGLGDEQKIRLARGEKPVIAPFPKNVSLEDDSDDFEEGLPQDNLQEEQQGEEKPQDDEESQDDVDTSDLFAAGDDVDLSAFEDDTSESAPAEPAADTASVDNADNNEQTAAPSVADDLNLGDLASGEDEGGSSSDEFNLDDLNLDEGTTAPDGSESTANDEFNLDDLNLDDIPTGDAATGDDFDMSGLDAGDGDTTAQADDTSGADEFNLDDLNLDEGTTAPDGSESIASDGFNLDDLNLDDIPTGDAATGDDFDMSGLDTGDGDTTAQAGDTSGADEFNLDDLNLDESTTAPDGSESTTNDEFNLDDLNLDDIPTGDAAAGDDFDMSGLDLSDGASSSGESSDEIDLSDLSLDEGTGGAATSSSDGFDLSDLDLEGGTGGDNTGGTNQDIDLSDFDLPSSSGEESAKSTDDIGMSDFSLPDVDLSPETKVPEEEIPEALDIDSLDFGGGDDDFALADADAASEDDFHIPGFSDTKTAKMEKFKGGSKEDTSKPKNTFTDTEYKRFLKNLSTYPLNVRVALEDFVVKNEFTDDAVFAVLEKVLRKVPARQLATELEKLLDIPIDVPHDFEHRSVAEYESYKKSIEYQLKNRIIPGALFTAAAALIIYCIFTLTNNLIYKPLRASSLYKQGYALLEDSQFPQSEERFNQALVFHPVKKWFFRYAEGYKGKRQYERARMMYRAVLNRYNHDKKAGLDWADMEIYDLLNYEEGERILKREVLDYHVNDPAALLALGDCYLEWATERADDKFPRAKEQYDLLVELYGQKPLYLSRQLRYFIRTDNLREVLVYKDYLLLQKKALQGKDLVELSGYMLDKRYGKLRPSEENLRSAVEGVRGLLEVALRAAPDDSTALYNMGRYFVETSNGKNAVNVLRASIAAFEKQPRRGRRDTYKYINAHRLLGEEMRNEKEYLTAEDLYGQGIEIFERERESSGFESDENVGKLYADLADLDYFIAGDDEAALKNYVNAVNNKNDTSSIRYRIGWLQYQSQNYPEALGSFIKSKDTNDNDTHLLLALANTLSMSGDDYIAQGHYEKLLSLLDVQRANAGAVLPQIREDHADLVDTYMKASNNLGVTLSRLASQTGDSVLNSRSIVYLQESLRAWDAMTRNQVTMIRLEGSNLAEQNIKYITHPMSDFTPEIYTQIPRTLYGEEGLE